MARWAHSHPDTKKSFVLGLCCDKKDVCFCDGCKFVEESEPHSQLWVGGCVKQAGYPLDGTMWRK